MAPKKAGAAAEALPFDTSALDTLAAPLLEATVEQLNTGTFDKRAWTATQDQIGRIALFRTLYPGDAASLAGSSADAIQDYFRRKFPPDVIDSDAAMQVCAGWEYWLLLVTACALRVCGCACTQ